MNAVRVPLIRRALQNVHRDQRAHIDLRSRPLEGLRVLDVGCGGGLLSEPLGRLGAQVTGIDASPQNVAAATHHVRLDDELSKRVEYQCISVEDLAASGAQYDGVVCSEVLEHVADLPSFLAALTSLIAPGGAMVLTTINRTLPSFALGIMAAEYVLRLVPAGTHEWTKFVTPEEIAQCLETPLPSSYHHTTNPLSALFPLPRPDASLQQPAAGPGPTGVVIEHITGLRYNPVSNSWSTSADTAINYAVVARKLTAEEAAAAPTATPAAPVEV